ncbi:MAG TPA: 5,6-dimethylbenzimidazole synthase [Alphaproteobacteria bacterium]|nr:5,6-dimethylbenzimidazole synthase [Alphaproteobacteria bacterium]
MSETGLFDAAFRARLADLVAWRRDVRRFRPDPIPEGALERLIALACLAPSVGLSQPWRFALVEERTRRAAIRAEFERCNKAALDSYEGERAQLYARLKLAGLDQAPVHLAVFADRATQQGHGLGRATMPEMAEYSAVMAIHTIWLAARAEGLGLGWVSILEPARVLDILELPRDWRFLGYLCIGYPEAEDNVPALERAGWEQRRDPAEFILKR